MPSARATREREYAVNNVYGNLAFNIYGSGGAAVREVPDAGAREREAQEAREREREARRERTAAHNEAVEQARRAQSVSAAGVLGVALCAVFMVLVILSYVRLNSISTEISQLSGEIETLEIEETRLKVEYERAFNLNAVKEYAVSQLGMVRLTEANTVVVTMNREDRTQVLAEDDSAGMGLIEAAREFVASLTEYLK